MPLYFDTPGLRFDDGYRFDQVEDFPNKPGSLPQPPLSPELHPKQQARKHKMNARQRAQLNRLIRVQAFCNDNTAAFTNTPAKPGDVKFASAKAALALLIPQITAQQSVQASGSYGQASTDQAVEREELGVILRTTSRTASAIAIDDNDPGLMDRFRVPTSDNDALLAATGMAFANAIVELGLEAKFAEHGYEGDIVADLRAEAQDVLDAEGDQGGAIEGQGGATATLPGLMRQGAAGVKCLDAIIKNRFRNSAGVLGAWKIASHVTATGGGADDTPPAPPAPPVG